MYRADNIDIESPQTKAGAGALTNISEDVETFIRIIEMTGQKETLIRIVYSNNETEGDIIESTGDFKTLKFILELIKIREDPKCFNSPQTFSQDELDASLIFSCLRGYTFIVQVLIHLGADLQTRDKNGNTPLLICAENGFTSTGKYLILREADVTAANNCGNTALILAAGSSGSVETVRLLLAQPGINVNHQNMKGNTALMKATEVMDVNVIRLLLDSHKNAAEALDGIKNCRHETAQNIADRLGLGKVVKLLAKAECEPILAAVRACDVDSFNVLINCQLYDSSKMCSVINDTFKEIIKKGGTKFSAAEQIIIQRLVKCGANMADHHGPIFTVARLKSCKVLELLVESVAHFYSSVYCKKRKALLKIAVENGRIDLIELLLKFSLAPHLNYYHIKCAITNGQTDCAKFLAKHVAACVKYACTSAVGSHINLKCMKFLIENFQTEVKQLAYTGDMDEPLVYASNYGDTEIIGLLLDVGASINCVDKNERTALMRSKCAEVVHFLVDRGAVVNKYSGTEQCFSPALMYNLNRSYNNGPETNMEIVEALLKCGANVNGRNLAGRTPLIAALLKRDSRDTAQLLLDYGANVNGRNSAGSTPLMLALSRKGGRSTVQLLLDYGADYNMTNSKGDTILSLAVSENRTDNILCLLQFSKYSKDILNFKTSHQPAAVIVAARKGNFKVVKHLVDHGADPSITDESGHTMFSIRSGIYCAQPQALSCMAYLLDQGAYVSPEVLHSLILKRNIKCIPKLIQCGFSPLEMSNLIIPHNAVNYPGFVTVSPFSVALMINNASLARYFVASLFLTKLDICRLASYQVIREYFKKRARDCLCLLDELSAQPMSLFTLAFLAVQTAVGSTQGRQERISKLPLPQIIKDRLLFKLKETKVGYDPSVTPPFRADLRP